MGARTDTGTGTQQLSKHAVLEALAHVDDPEYPGISVIDMGMIDYVDVTAGDTHGSVVVGLITTFSGCPALDVIRRDITDAVEALLDGGCDVEVKQSTKPWNTSRLSKHAHEVMARDFTVAVALPTKPTLCPRCEASALVEQSAFGPARCRAVHRCGTCGEIVEVMRSA